MNLTEVMTASVCWILLMHMQAQQVNQAFVELHRWQVMNQAYLVLADVRELYHSGLLATQIQSLFVQSLLAQAKLLQHSKLMLMPQGKQYRIVLSWRDNKMHTLTQVVADESS